jgi:DNA-binding response OmpR family regulator
MRLLLIEDNLQLLETLKEELSQQYAVDAVPTGKEGLYLGQINSYDLIVLDIGLPDTDGLEVCRSLRQKDITVPILVLTGHASLEDKVTAFDWGADDYLTKPFQLLELLARLRALLRRPIPQSMGNILVVEDLELDLTSRIVHRSSKPIPLRRKELDLLELLMRNQGKVVTRSMILEHVWNSDVNAFTNAIDVHIKHLRDQVDRPFATKLIQTVYGIGYKFTSTQLTGIHHKESET